MGIYGYSITPYGGGKDISVSVTDSREIGTQATLPSGQSLWLTAHGCPRLAPDTPAGREFLERETGASPLRKMHKCDDGQYRPVS